MSRTLLIPTILFLLPLSSCSTPDDPVTSTASPLAATGANSRECDDAVWLALGSGTGEWLWGVWGNDDDDIWTVGGGGTTLRYNGRCWLPQMSPGPSAVASAGDVLCDVWVSAPQAYAVGIGGLIRWFDGDQWLTQPSGTQENLFGVWGIGSDVFAIGTSGTILHNDGSGWSAMQSPTGLSLFGVWGSAAQGHADM